MLLIHTLKTDDLGHLGVGVPVVQGGRLMLCHALQQPLVRKAARLLKIFGIARHGIGIGKHLVHAAILLLQRLLYLLVGEVLHQCHAPIAEAQKHAACILSVGIEPGVTQSGKEFMDIIERHPPFPHHIHLARGKTGEELPGTWHTAHIAVHQGVGTVLPCLLRLVNTVQAPAQPLCQPLFGRWLLARCPCDGQGTDIVSAHMTVKSGPVGKGFSALFYARLVLIGLHQSAGIIGKQHRVVELHGSEQGSLVEPYIRQGKQLRIECRLGIAFRCARSEQCGEQQ